MTARSPQPISASYEGEVVSLDGGRLVISGPFRPGDAITLHPGARVAVLTGHDAEAYRE